mmetsp:Transcript_44295/g.87853  ORF Transcript_44295/g.87853 Transcript_44295/m.87853 type:complete len:211 (+) Transcript_44295:143-775(+)
MPLNAECSAAVAAAAVSELGESLRHRIAHVEAPEGTIPSQSGLVVKAHGNQNLPAAAPPVQGMQSTGRPRHMARSATDADPGPPETSRHASAVPASASRASAWVLPATCRITRLRPEFSSLESSGPATVSRTSPGISNRTPRPPSPSERPNLDASWINASATTCCTADMPFVTSSNCVKRCAKCRPSSWQSSFTPFWYHSRLPKMARRGR